MSLYKGQRVAGLVFGAIALATLLLAPSPGARADEWDPLPHVLARSEQFFARRAASSPDGIARDPRMVVHGPEEIRLNITSQLLAYCERYADTGDPRYLEAVVLRADFLVARLDEIRTHSAFDGMLGYALLAAYAATGDPAYKAPVDAIAERCKQLAGWDNTLNWGLMCAMCLAEVHAQSGDESARDKVHAIIGSLATYQNPDGSFPHYCPHSADLHYTAWMGTELMLVARSLPYFYPPIAEIVTGVRSFLAERIDARGMPVYEECDQDQNCQRYYSQGSGCPEDYDTRGWTNELTYHAVVFRAVDSEVNDDRVYYDVMDFLVGLEAEGGYPDKWGFPPPNDDPIRIWATASPSVLRTSLVFWLMAALDRGGFPDDPHSVRLTSATGIPATASMPRSPPSVSASPARLTLLAMDPVVVNPSSRASLVRFALSGRQVVRLSIHDVTGRVVRELAGSELPAGKHAIVWDGRNGAGEAAACGVYFCRLDAGREVETRKIALVH
jgi:hypothetical protein